MNERARSLLVAGALAICLVAGSPPRIVGDGGEYVAQAMNFAMLNAPPLTGGAIAHIEPRVRALDPVLAEWDIEQATVPSADRRRDFVHFWFYALVVTPAFWIVDAAGASPLYAFTLTNLALLGAAIWVVLPRIGAAATALLFAGPLIWWIDKPHTEVFTVSLLAIAFALMRDRPAIALVAAGMASTQNVPVAIVYVAMVAWAPISRGLGVLTGRAWLAGALAGGALVLLHPAYTYLRHGTPSLLLSATRPGMPPLAELTAVLLDPTMGLVGNYPMFLIATIAGAIVLSRARPSALASPDVIAAAVSALLFVHAFARTANLHHGGTPSLTRYALWLIPVAIPLFAALHHVASGTWRRALVVAAVVSSLASVFAFHPGVAQNSREPTWLATWLWTAHPTWNDPLPEVFSETLLRVEGTTVPAATAGCEKLLVAAGRPDEGAWPIPCYPATLPGRCRVPNTPCYANRAEDAYVISEAPGRDDRLLRDRGRTWPTEAEPHVRAIFDEWDWWRLSRARPAVQAIRAFHDASGVTLGTDDRFLAVVRPHGPEAAVRLRPLVSPMHGKLVDARTGVVLETLAFDGTPLDLWTIAIPADRDLAILALVGSPHGK